MEFRVLHWYRRPKVRARHQTWRTDRLGHRHAQRTPISSPSRGPATPYHAPLSVSAVGAIADLIVVDGNPLQNLDLIATPQTAFTVIMKNGQLIKSEAA
jgi:hypothetical protein